ncbi:MAG: hypothetical protein DRN71_05335 [Candidatus Nanohalarchaeota archaeon]|nr:MAG: hypothetical protein DRN71_05335 [Candidatus Nanohaloarchaeota archaeon]
MRVSLNTRVLSIFGLLVLLYLIFRSGVGSIVPILLDLKMEYVLISIAIIPVIIYLKGYKWNLIMRAHGMDYSTAYASKVWLIGLFTGTFTPGRVGDVVRIFYVGGGKSAGKPLSTVLLDRVYDIGALLLISCFGGVMIFYWFEMAMSMIFFAVLVFVFGLYLVSNKGIVRKVLRPVFVRFIPVSMKSKLKLNFNEFYEGFYLFAKNRGVVAGVAMLTVALWLVSIMQEYMLVMALGLEGQVSIYYLVAISPIVTILTLLPISVSGIGPRDVSMIYFFSLVGAASEYAISFSILLLLLYWAYTAVGGVVWLFYPRKIKISF